MFLLNQYLFVLYLFSSLFHSKIINRGDDNENFSQNIDAIRVSVIAEGSELASAIPSLLEGIGILDCNITILNDFDATNQVRYWD